MKLSFLFLLLVNFKISHAQRHNPSALFEAVEAALIKKDNLMNLMGLFYPPTQIQPNHVRLEIGDITVQNITDKNDYYGYPAFFCNDHAECRYDGNFPINYDLYVFEDDKSYSKLLAYISSDPLYMELFDILSYRFYGTLTFFQPQKSYRYYSHDVGISLSIDSLESIPLNEEFYVAMEMALSWVSF